MIFRDEEKCCIILTFYLKSNPINLRVENLRVDIREQQAFVYGITGGIPHYINKLGFTNGLKELAEKGEVRPVSLEDMYR